MSDTILVLQQVPHEGLGSIYPLLRRHGVSEQVIPCYREDARIPDSLEGFSGLIIMGGPMSANDSDPVLAAQLRLAESAVRSDFPTLGICLGSQLIARAAGARISRGATPEIGWDQVHLSLESADDPLFTGLPNPLPVFQWHFDGFDLPRGAVHLASSPRFPHQAFRLGQRVYGLQFHVETDAPMIKEWVAVNRHELEAHPEIDRTPMETDSDARCHELSLVAEKIIARWLGTLAARG
ncbi:MAG: type 1 glutamine amidotransferase [Nitrospirota bacterium]|nr:type 1 glutamine amidotransferase [Nitrospirota bacterium]